MASASCSWSARAEPVGRFAWPPEYYLSDVFTVLALDMDLEAFNERARDNLAEVAREAEDVLATVAVSTGIGFPPWWNDQRCTELKTADYPGLKRPWNVQFALRPDTRFRLPRQAKSSSSQSSSGGEST